MALSDYSPRVAQVLNGTGHMEYPGKGQGELVWDWGDGTVERFSGYHHQEDVHPVHRYASTGAYDVTLTAQAGAASSSVVQSITVRSDRSAVAVFVPLVAERFIPWDEQQSIATSIVQAVQAEGFEASVFYYDDQVELEQWARGFLGDPVRDAIVILDLCPAVLYAGERDRSLAERWIESGDGIIWTGAQPFAEYVFADGTTSATDAGEHGADDVLDAALPGICTGSGWQQPTPLGARELPSLAAFDSDYALRTSQLGPGWRVDRLHALGNPGESDAV
ncbi:MAG: PKD domain-containing protein [Planctomycetota bacterium]